MSSDPVGEDRPHRASLVEARVRRQLSRQLVRRGWVPTVVPYVGYGGAGWARVLARVVLAAPGSPVEDVEDARGWRRFFTPWIGGVPVRLGVGSHTHDTVSRPDGYVDIRVTHDLDAGWHTATLQVGDAEPVETPLRIVGGGTRLGLLSDIDDTVIVTMLPRPLVAFRNAFLVMESARRPVPGMAELYRQVLDTHEDVFVIYLSTGAWNIAAPLARFLARHGYPPGPLLLTDWGPTQTGWFRSGQAHKRTELRRLLDELPDLSWLLVGDDGQHDPSLYAEAAADAPDRVVAVAIRQLTLTQQVVGHGTVVPADDVAAAGTVVPTVAAPDGHGLRDELRRIGLLRRE
jgi:phosphatidate phosphatase APP1